MAENPYKFGLLGCGRAGKHYIRTINNMSNAQIVALYTGNPENSKLVKNKVRCYPTIKDILEAQNLDGIIIATPPHTHASIMHECVNNLMPFIVEKPFTTSLKDAILLKTFIKEAKVPCLVGHTQLFNPAYVEFCKRFKNQKIKTLESDVSAFGPFREDVSMLWDWAPHDLAMCLNLIKENPTKIKCELVPHENYPNSGELKIKLKFPSVEALIKINNLGKQKYRSFVASSSFQKMTLFGEELFETRNDKITAISTPSVTPFTEVVLSFIEAIESNSYNGLDLAIDVVSLLDKCDQSLKNNNYFDI